jgi:hypothetical protein
MIHHIVLWKLKDFAEGKSKKENAILVKEKLENLKSMIPNIVELRVGINLESIPANFDVALHSLFENIEDLNSYQKHKEHKTVAEWIGKIRETRTCVDYEY